MPIYEFYSPDTHKVYSFFARTLSQGQAIPRCPDRPDARMERLISRFAVTGRAKEQPEGGTDDALDPRMEKVMAEMEREMAGIDEDNPDPRKLGSLMRKMTEATGQKVPAEMEEMLRRLESGEDPEKLEEEFGDAMEGLEDGAFGLPGEEEEETGSRSRSQKSPPHRDPTLYEMRDFI